MILQFDQVDASGHLGYFSQSVLPLVRPAGSLIPSGASISTGVQIVPHLELSSESRARIRLMYCLTSALSVYIRYGEIVLLLLCIPCDADFLTLKELYGEIIVHYQDVSTISLTATHFSSFFSE